MDFEKIRCNCGTCGSDDPEKETKPEGETTEAPAEEEEEKKED